MQLIIRFSENVRPESLTVHLHAPAHDRKEGASTVYATKCRKTYARVWHNEALRRGRYSHLVETEAFVTCWRCLLEDKLGLTDVN